MRELERELDPQPTPDAPIVLVGRGPVGRSLASAASAAGLPLRLAASAQAREAAGGATAVLICVPDEAIAPVCERVAAAEPAPKLVGHPSGAGSLAALEPAFAAGAATFSLHPLQTFPDDDTSVEGTPAAVAGSDEAAVAFARALARRLGMRPFDMPEQRRAAYHAAACMASNFLVALQEASAELLARAGGDIDPQEARELLAPLVLRTAANWAERGPAALTGPIARGDRATVARHRTALAELAPEMLDAYDALAGRTEALAARPPEGPAAPKSSEELATSAAPDSGGRA